MTTVQELIDELRKFPANANCYVNGGDKAGVVIVSADGRDTVGHIVTGTAEAKEPSTIEVVF